MKLQARNLEPNIRGTDVALLRTELRQLGFNIVDLDGFFGSTTFLAVQAFQKQKGIEPANGIVDEDTARLINKADDELEVDARVVLGSVLREDGSPVPHARVRAFDRGIRDETRLGEIRTDEPRRRRLGAPRSRPAGRAHRRPLSGIGDTEEPVAAYSRRLLVTKPATRSIWHETQR